MYNKIIKKLINLLNDLEAQYNLCKSSFNSAVSSEAKKYLIEEANSIINLYDSIASDLKVYKTLYDRLNRMTDVSQRKAYSIEISSFETKICNKYSIPIKNGIGSISLGSVAVGVVAVPLIISSITGSQVKEKTIESISYSTNSQVGIVESSQVFDSKYETISTENKSTVAESPRQVVSYNYQDVKYDDTIKIFVTPGNESNSRGTPYPLEQYVEGVLTGEHVAQSYYNLYLKGELSEQELVESLKAFAIIARSYGLYQTVFSPKHLNDHKITNTSTKQCFTPIHLEENTMVAKLARAAALSTAGMTLTVDDLPLNARYDSFTSGGRIKDGNYVGTYYILDRKGRTIGEQELFVPTSWVDIKSGLRKGHRCGGSQYAIAALSKQGLNALEIAKYFYTDEAQIKYFNYQNETFGDEVVYNNMSRS